MRKIMRSGWIRAAIVLLSILLLLWSALECGRAVIKNTVSPWTPNYEKKDISYLLDGRELSGEDYELLYRQTGLTRLGVDGLLRAERASQILNIQDDFFATDAIVASNMPFFVTSFDRASGHYEYPELQNGDIICAFSTYFSFAMLGHCAIVVDAELGMLAETTGYDSPFNYVHATEFFTNSTYALLRPACDAETKARAVKFATEEMLGTEYDILAGIFEPKAPEELRKTHCSHAVWYAYMQAGLDLDSNGGKIVTPRDILRSDKLELVSSRGLDIYELVP